MKHFCVILICLTFLLACEPEEYDGSEVAIQETNLGYELVVNGSPFYAKGAVGYHYLDALKNAGGNAIRIRATAAHLDSAAKYGFMAIAGLPVMAERYGMDYNNEQAVQQQFDSIMARVNRLKHHPALLAWVLGNELDHIPGETTYNEKVWDAVNQLSIAIHEADPHHPVMTVVGTGRRPKMATIVEKCSDLDMLGVNTYADIGEVHDWLLEYGWNTPYMITEWGVSGFWQVPKTDFGLPIEENSTEKARNYQLRYANAIAGHPTRCLGSFVFLWRQHQERTHTWFGMFDEAGRHSDAVAVMQHAWTEQWPSNRAPIIDSMTLAGMHATESIHLKTGSEMKAVVYTYDPNDDPVEIAWEVLPENTEFGYGGQGEEKPAAVMGAIRSGASPAEAIMITPGTPGPYRIFVYVYDGNNHFATANIPFLVEE